MIDLPRNDSPKIDLTVEFREITSELAPKWSFQLKFKNNASSDLALSLWGSQLFVRNFSPKNALKAVSGRLKLPRLSDPTLKDLLHLPRQKEVETHFEIDATQWLGGLPYQPKGGISEKTKYLHLNTLVKDPIDLELSFGFEPGMNANPLPEYLNPGETFFPNTILSSNKVVLRLNPKLPAGNEPPLS